MHSTIKFFFESEIDPIQFGHMSKFHVSFWKCNKNSNFFSIQYANVYHVCLRVSVCMRECVCVCDLMIITKNKIKTISTSYQIRITYLEDFVWLRMASRHVNYLNRDDWRQLQLMRLPYIFWLKRCMKQTEMNQCNSNTIQIQLKLNGGVQIKIKTVEISIIFTIGNDRFAAMLDVDDRTRFVFKPFRFMTNF